MRYSIDLRQRREFEQWLITKDMGIGLSTLPILQPTVESFALAKMKLVAVLHLEHPLCDKEVVSLEDISCEPLITVSDDAIVRQFVENAFKLRGLPFDLRGETASSMMTCLLVSKGLGVGISDPMSAISMNNHGLAIRRLEPAMEVSYGVIYPSEKGLTPAAEQLSERLKIVVRELHERMPALF